MPFSTNYFKEETKKYIENNFDKTIRILDVGSGAGTYSNLLKPLGYKNIDCVEIFEEYVEKFGLKFKYENVIVGDITNVEIDFKKYDLIILGDVLEHIEKNAAIKLIERIKNIPTIIAIPFESEQGEHFGNIYETHLQPDLTLENFTEKFTDFNPICLRFDYGIFINQKPKEIYFEVGQMQLPNNYLKYVVKNYPDSEYIYLNPQPKIEISKPKNDNKVTIVTGLWDLGRGKISDSFKRGYDDYKEKFSQLLKTDVNMYIFCDPSDEDFIWEYRSRENTVINKMSLNELRDWFNFTKLTNEIRQKEEWLSQASWLRESPQATLEGYNPLVMSKMFMLNNVTIWNPFNSEYFFWIDAGITNTVHYGYFTHDKVFDKLPNLIDNNNDFIFLTYPYEGASEIHGFEKKAIAKYCNTDYVKFVCRGGFFGGKKERINELNGLYYSYLSNSLSENLMGTEESVFTIILYNHPNLVSQYVIKDDGLIWPFFEQLKNGEIDKLPQIIELNKNKTIHIPDNIDEGLYILKSNNPNQLESLIRILTEHNPEILNTSETYFLNKSNDTSKDETYKKICNINNITYSSVNDSPIVNNFFEDLKKERIRVLTEKLNKVNQVSLYVIGFNSPNQFSTLIKSMIEYDEDFIKKPKKYLLNNSTDRSTDAAYEEICAMYDFEIINPGENLGICGGRQFVAEHFDKTDAEFYWWFEDDMFFYPKKGEVCRNGFNRYVSNLYDKSMRIIQTENFDFLKMNFTEFFGDNSTQFSWYNVPQHVREEFWPEKQKLPQMGLDPNAPRTVFKNIKSLDGVPYADGEIYYCNWVQVVSRKGNQKMFLETKWAHAYEQTWMSFMYQETKKGNLNGGLLLMTPTEHNRFEHYAANLRKES